MQPSAYSLFRFDQCRSSLSTETSRDPVIRGILSTLAGTQDNAKSRRENRFEVDDVDVDVDGEEAVVMREEEEEEKKVPPDFNFMAVGGAGLAVAPHHQHGVGRNSVSTRVALSSYLRAFITLPASLAFGYRST